MRLVLAMLLGACSVRPLPLPLDQETALDLAAPRDFGVPDLVAPHDFGVRVSGDLSVIRDFASAPDLFGFFNTLVPGDMFHAVTQISAGDGSVCALVQGGIKCWGSNIFGQLGNGTVVDSAVPVDVAGLSSGVAAVSSGYDRACALTTGGGVKCWGQERTAAIETPVDVSGLSSGMVAVAAGGPFACAITSAGGVVCWGQNDVGELGNGTMTNSFDVPVTVSGLSSGVVAIAAGDFHACALTSTGGVQCWGANVQGQLGNNSTVNSAYPVSVVGLSSGVVAITAGVNHTCAVTSAGAAKCWGSNQYGEGGNPMSDGMVPADVVGLSSGVAGISAGNLRTCALTAAGAVTCWGAQANDSLLGSDVPVGVPSLPAGVAAVSVGNLVTCVLTTEGVVGCWGSNRQGALGDNSAVDSAVPVEVIGL